MTHSDNEKQEVIALFNAIKLGELIPGKDPVKNEKWMSLYVNGEATESQKKAFVMWEEFMKANPTFVPIPIRDYTKERNDRCKPVAEKILKLMLDHDLLLSDLQYLNEITKQQLDGAFKHIIHVHANDVFTLMKKNLEKCVHQAQEYFWNKDPADVSVGEVENVLKKINIQKGIEKESRG